MGHSLFTSEAVSVGHPDKVADQISDAILDACLEADPHSKVACETMVCTGLVMLSGEITTTAHIDYQEIVRETLRKIGYNDPQLGFDYRSCAVISSIRRQSEDIAMGVLEGRGLFKAQGAGDQGMMFGYATDETEELMPLPITLANRLMEEVRRCRMEGEIPYLRPDAKAQVTIEYNEAAEPIRVHTIVLSTQHTAETTHETVMKDMRALIGRVIPGHLLDAKSLYYINPTGRFVDGGPAADCGLTGRKLMVDTYGGMGRHGGGAFSGKDPSKVDRSAAYAARYVAKNLVAAGFARRCEVQVAYAIGVAHPISIKIDTFGTASVEEGLLCKAVEKVFDLSPRGVTEMLDLLRPIYGQTSSGGHFGRPQFTWERTDRIDSLRTIIAQMQQPAKSEELLATPTPA